MVYKMSDIILGSGTGVGSLPHKDAEKAVKMSINSFCRFPHWPQTPAFSDRGNMIDQAVFALENFGLVKCLPSGSYMFCEDDPDWHKNFTDFFEFYKEFMEGSGSEGLIDHYFSLPEQGFPGFYIFKEIVQKLDASKTVLKGQTAGPLTVGLALKDSSGKPSIYSEMLREILIMCIHLQIFWQFKELNEYANDTIVFVDEPSLTALGSSAYVALKKRWVKDSLERLIELLKTEDCNLGFHACGGGDWSVPFELDFKIVNFDAYNYFESLFSYRDQLKKFLDGGGILAWGIVPTDFNGNPEDLLDLLEDKIELLEEIGIDRQRLMNNILITPACGLGSSDLKTSEKVYDAVKFISNNYLTEDYGRAKNI